MTGDMWSDFNSQSLGVRLDGSQIRETDDHGNPITGDTLLILISAADTPLAFALPARKPSERWERLLDTSDRRWARRSLHDESRYELAARAVALFRLAEPNGSLP